MLELLLVLMQAVAAGEPPPPPQTVTVTGTRLPNAPADAVVDMPSDDTAGGEYVAIWPSGAYNARRDGKVVLSCLIDVHGVAERCAVASESPKGQGFGAAALQMRPTFKLKPRTGPDGAAVNATMNIAVSFKAPDPDLPSGGDFDPKRSRTMYVRGNPMPMREVTMVAKPIWVSAPSFDDWTAAYPATGRNIEGYAMAHCRVLGSGALTDCGIVKELPDLHGFASAAKGLAARFRLDPDQARVVKSSSLWVDIPIRLPPPGGERIVAAPQWLTSIDPAAHPKLFPADAAARGLTTGRGIAVCTVAADGSMVGCSSDAAGSDSPSFGEAAAALAPGMRMNLWGADAAPVVGGTIRIAVRLNLREASGS